MHLPVKNTIIDTKYCLFRWFLFLFLIYVTTAAMPCAVVNSLGLFGEVKASAIICGEKEEAAEAAVKRYKSDSRGARKISIQAWLSGTSLAGTKEADIFNIWFVLSVAVLHFYYVQHINRLPEKDTIVTLKIRMDN